MLDATQSQPAKSRVCFVIIGVPLTALGVIATLIVMLHGPFFLQPSLDQIQDLARLRMGMVSDADVRGIETIATYRTSTAQAAEQILKRYRGIEAFVCGWLIVAGLAAIVATRMTGKLSPDTFAHQTHR